MQQDQALKSLVRSLTLIRASVSGTHPIFSCRLVCLDEAALCIQPLEPQRSCLSSQKYFQ